MNLAALTARRVIPLSCLVLLALGRASGQDAYIKSLANQGWYHVKATEVLQPVAGEEFFVVGTNSSGTEIYGATIGVNGKTVKTFKLKPNVSALQLVDFITYEYAGKEMFALLGHDSGAEVQLFILDVKGNLLADWGYPISHPTGNQGFSAQKIAWDPGKERLAIVGNVRSFGPDYDVGLFTTNAIGKVVDEMRWYEFGMGGAFRSCQAFGLVYDPWFGGFLVGVQASAWLGETGFMVFPVTYTGDPVHGHAPWTVKSFRALGLSLDLTHAQVLVYGDDFAFGPGVSYQDLCFWMDDVSVIQSGTSGTPDFTRFSNELGQLEVVRDGAFGVVDPTVYSISGLCNNQPCVTYFDVGPNHITPRSRVEAWAFGYVIDLLHLTNYSVNPAGYGLDQILVGWTGGYNYTAYSRRTSTGEFDPNCEVAPARLEDAQEFVSLLHPSIKLKHTYDKGHGLGTTVVAQTFQGTPVCGYPGFADGSAH